VSDAWTPHPWVTQQRERVGFALQVLPINTEGDPVGRMLAAGRLAETLGFDAFFFGDHPAWGPECWVHMAALAVQTKRMRLGTGVACALYRHPVLLARLAADLDNLSGGRLILGLGCGWDANEFANLGLPFAPARVRQEALAEAIAIVRGVWGAEPFTLNGAHFQTSNARVTPPPVQQPAPPLLIAGGGEQVTLRQVAHFADACQLGSFGMVGGEGTIAAIERKLEVLQAHCTALGRPYETVLRTHFTGWLILAENDERLRAKVARFFPEGIEQRFAGPWRGFAVPATVEEAIASDRALIAAGIQYFVVNTLDAADEETIRLLAEQVMPAVQE
jgi:alkanesulfonate monooxygenase SsuD/methylene tetrahydromethanopterin reductase-like flavin-dependent oxidoreductase (luciferase family)